MQVIELFQNYRANKARLTLLNERKEEIRQEIDRMKESILEDHQHISPSLDSLPHGSGIGNPTQSIAVMMADGTTPEIQQQEKKLREIMQEAACLDRLIRYADILLEGLSEKERYIIQAHLIDGYSWNEISDESKYQLSIDGLRKVQKRAIQRMDVAYHG